jgi:hypothetical protein
MINSSLIFCDFTNLFGFFSPIFSHCNMIYFNLAIFTSYICDFFSYFTQLITFNLQDLLIFSYLPLASSIFGLIFACFGFLTVIIPLVYLAGRAGKILDTAAKVVVILAGSSNLYKNHGGSYGSSDDSDKDKNKEKDKDKDKTNEDKNENETKTTNDSSSDSNTASK